jgi:acyl-CoA dehydrogenase
MNDRTLLETSVRSVFAEFVPTSLGSSTEDVDGVESLRAALSEAGYPWVGVPEKHGGSGGSIDDACTIWREEGRAASPVPLADVSLAGWLLAEADLSLAQGAWTAAPPRDTLAATLVEEGLRLRGSLSGVPHANQSQLIVAMAWPSMAGVEEPEASYVVAVPRQTVDVSVNVNVAGESRDDVVFDDVVLPAEHFRRVPAHTGDDFLLRGAMTRIQLSCGAMESALTCALAHTSERTQFGRPIGSFQAVQHLAVRAAEHKILAETAALSVGSTDSPSSLEIVCAKVIAVEAASVVAATCHQICGAIGMTSEFPLHRWTRRLWAWRDEYGGGAYWKRRLGAEVRRMGAEGLWDMVTRDN